MGPSWGPSSRLDWPSPPLRAVRPASPGGWEVAGTPAEMEAQAAAPPASRSGRWVRPSHTTLRPPSVFLLFTLFFEQHHLSSEQHHLSSAIKITNFLPRVHIYC